MFNRKTRKTFHVSTTRVYLAGQKSVMTRMLQYLRPYTSRGGYRMTTDSALLAL